MPSPPLSTQGSLGTGMSTRPSVCKASWVKDPKLLYTFIISLMQTEDTNQCKWCLGRKWFWLKTYSLICWTNVQESLSADPLQQTFWCWQNQIPPQAVLLGDIKYVKALVCRSTDHRSGRMIWLVFCCVGTGMLPTKHPSLSKDHWNPYLNQGAGL